MPSRRALVAVSAISAYYILVFAALALVRLFYPYEVNWQEGNMLLMAARVAAGAPLYPAPSLDYIPFLYPPLYFYLSAGMMKLLGTGYLAMRALTICATTTAAALLYRAVRQERPRWVSLMAVGVFIGFFGRGTFDYDSGRVDLPALAFLFGSLLILFADGLSPGRALLGGLLGGLAILTKQTMVIYLVAGAAWCFGRRSSRALALLYLGAAGATCVAVLAAMGLLDDRWFYFYILKVPATHHIRAFKLLVLGPAFALVTLPIALFVGLARRSAALRDDPWAVMLWAALVGGVVLAAKDAGSVNHFFPLALFGALQLGRQVARLERRWPRAVGPLVIAQLVLLYYPPSLAWPTRADREAGDRLIAALKSIDGDVYLPALPAYAVMAGKPWHAHYAAACDIFQLDTTLRDQIRDRIRARAYAAVLPRVDVDPRDPGLCDVPELDRHYALGGRLPIPPMPSPGEIAVGRPSLFGLVHAGQVGPLYLPRRDR